MIKSILAALEVLGDSPLGLMVKPIVKFIKRTNMGSVKVIEIQYDEVQLNEHKLKKESTPIQDLNTKESEKTSLPKTAAPPPPIPPRLVSKKAAPKGGAKHAGYSGTIGVSGTAGASGRAGTSGDYSGTGGRIQWASDVPLPYTPNINNVYYSGTFTEWFESHNHHNHKIRSTGPR